MLVTSDPFDTAHRRDAVLRAWASSPTRFREDANAEEDLVVGGYADRLLVELAQNAADAASRVGVAGTLRVRLRDGVLTAANTGAPLDKGGVDGLTSLRASSKRDGDTAGRFGVGFAAVLAVSDEPEVRSRGGGVRFSAIATRSMADELGGAVADEVARRGGRVPVLRLAWPVATAPVEGFDTEVVLPVRAGAEEAVRDLLAGFDPTLLLALPGLTTLDVDGRIVERRDDGDDVLLVEGGVLTRWRCSRRSGELSADLLADRPVEERARTAWWTLAATPVHDDGRLRRLDADQVVHAPTPSDEPLSLPLRLAASFPLDTSRRRVVPGALTDFLVAEAARAIADLASRLEPEPGALALVPRPALARAELDARICSAALDALAATPLLPLAEALFTDPPPADPDGPPAEHGAQAERVSGRQAIVAEPALASAVSILAEVVPGLLPAAYSTDRAARPALDALGVRRLGLGAAVDAVATVTRDPGWWRALYAALAETAPGLAEADALAGLPVPLADGRTVTGPRGLLLPGDGLPAEAVGALGLRVVHPDAVHPLLERLGAQSATPHSLLADDRVRAEVAHSFDAHDPEPIAEAILALVAAAGVGPGDEPWLGELALPADDGEWYPASELLLPGAPLASVVAADAPFEVAEAELVERWGADLLAAVGCLRTFPLADEDDVDLADIADLHLDAGEDWADAVDELVGTPSSGVRIERLHAVRDLELVDPDRWSDALTLLGAGKLRVVLATPAFALTGDGRRVEVPSYTRWWLASHPVLAGRRPTELRTPDAAALDGLFDRADGDADLLALLGCRTGLADVLDAVRADPRFAADLFARLADPARTVTPVLLREVYPRLAEALEGVRVAPPEAIRVAPDRVVPASEAAVLDAPWLLDALAGRSAVPGGSDPEAVADLLDIPLLSELG